MKKIYNTNESYFENIDSEEKAYWLGFMTADGYVGYRKKGLSQEEYSVGLDLRLQDISHLKKFSNNITDRELTVYEKTNKCRFIIYSKKMFEDLSKYNITPNKTFLINKIPDIRKDLKIHFIRGYFDGDGSVWEGKVKYKSRDGIIKETRTIGTEFVGTLEFLKDIEIELGIKGNFKKEIRRESNTYYLKYYKLKRSKLFFDLCYNNSTVYMQRKYDKFISFFDYSTKKPTNETNSKKTYQFDLNGNLIKEWAKIIEIERVLGFNNKRISACCTGKLTKAYGFIWTH